MEPIFRLRALDEAKADVTLSGTDAQAERPLRILLAASLILPVVIFSFAAWISYGHSFDEANDRLQRTLGIIHEHAAKVFETMELSGAYTDEIIGELSNADIKSSEADIHARFKALTDKMPQMRDLWVIDAAGHPLASATLFPMPSLDVSDRTYFRVQKDDPNAGFFVSEVLDSKAVEQRRIFLISRRRPSPDGSFRGVMTTAFAPEYFLDYYSHLPAQGDGVAALVRDDGAILARYPNRDANPPRLPPNSALLQAIQTHPEGIFRAASSVDGSDKLFAYRKLPRHKVYAVAALDVSAIVHEWFSALAYHLIFGVPATLAMLGLSWTALRRTRRASTAFSQVQQEVARREITEQALRQAHKMEAVGRLTGGIAHDFNNLLTAILGNIDMAIRRLAPGDERVHRSLSAARQASHRAATLVQRLLAFSRQHPQEVKAVAANRLVQGMLDLLRRTIGETIAIDTVLAADLWKTAVDPNQLENAILNLAVNSRDAMAEGGHLTIETANLFLDEAYAARHPGDIHPGDYVMIAVTDTGSGMSREVSDQAFDPFFTTKPTGVGSGLGLSMVYGFVKQSKGHIQIHSELGKGTSIELYFPRIANRSNLPEWPGSEAPGQDPAGGQNEFILLVEDDEEVNRFATDALRDLGYRVESAHDGAHALKIFRQHPDISLLFTDVVLPGGMNGRQIAEEAWKLRPGLKVLFATGYTRDAIIHEGRLDADVELLTKPFTPETLGRKVRQVLDGEPRAGSHPR
jgi:two-component system NtrC family sensor kinase